MINKEIKRRLNGLTKRVSEMHNTAFDFKNLRRIISPFVKTSVTHTHFGLKLPDHFGIRIIIDEETNYFTILTQSEDLVFETPITTNKKLVEFILKHELLTKCRACRRWV